MSSTSKEEEKKIEESKKKAAYAAVDEFVTEKDLVIGMGSGSTVVHVAERLGQLNQEKQLNITCVPTSFQSIQLIIDNKLTLSDLQRNPILDLDFDGADECDSKLNLIKGGGGCLTQEKIVASQSKKFIAIADFRKKTKTLGEQWKKGVPVEVVPISYVPVTKRVESLQFSRPYESDISSLKKEASNAFSNNAPKATLRMAGASKAGPVVTDNGNFILDIDFGTIHDPKFVHDELMRIPGVVETGLFMSEMVEKAFFGMKDGSVVTLDRSGKESIVN